MIFSTLRFTDEEGLSVQIEKHIIEAIGQGELKKGDKLPSTREASSHLSVSRNTIITAYENLECNGFIVTEKGKGTFVLQESYIPVSDYRIQWQDRVNSYATICKELDIIKTELPWEKGMISFKSIAPEGNLFDMEEFKRAFLDVCSLEGSKILNYGYAKGYEPLIQYLRGYMEEKGVETVEKDILITNGFTEGFDLVISSLTEPGNVMLCENPTHHTALKSMKAHGLTVIGVEMDNEGINIEQLEIHLKNDAPTFLYLIPSYHNPTGIVMKASRRREVYQLCEKYKVPIIEDGFNEELLYSSSHVSPIASLSSKGNSVIYIGSFSKILFPGLRIGWIFADKELISTLESVKRGRSIHSSFLDQAVLHQYLANGAFEKYVKKVRKYYKDNYHFTVEQVKKYVPHKQIMGEGGLHLFIELNDGIHAREVLDQCYKKGVVFTPGDLFYTDGTGSSTMRLGFSRLSKKDIKEGIKIIGEVVHGMG